MDIVGFSITIFRETYNLALFVYEVVQDVREYEGDKDQIRQKLEHEIFFLDAFNKFFLDPKSGGIIHDPNLPAAYPQRILSILQNLRDSLGVYSKLALKHYPPYQRLMLDDDGVEEHGDPNREHVSLGDTGKKERGPDFDKASFRARLKSLSLRAWDWSLFDKKKLVEVVAQFREWCGKLKEIMQFSMLFAIRFKDLAALKDFQNSDTAKKAGLEHVAQRQFLNRCKTIDEAPPLEGRLIETPDITNGSSATRLMRLVTGGEQPYGTPVAVEYKAYGVPPAMDDTSGQNLLKVKTNIKTLATVLMNSAFVEGEDQAPNDSSFNSPVLNAFQCIGYIDEPENSRMAFVFRLPAQVENHGSLQTLHAFIEEIDPRKKRPLNIISLEQRFAIAHNLCMTILNLHGSGWVHKSIRSTNIILLPGPSHLKHTPYVTGFEFSRPALAATEVSFDFDPDRNLYRHPSRQGYPTATFTKLHDLYALGVVLLEVGVWRTVTGRLKPGFEQAKKYGKIPSPEYVRQTLIKIAKDDLPPVMGGRYAKAVVKCLEGNFGVSGADTQMKELGLAFMEQVVDVMADGLKL